MNSIFKILKFKKNSFFFLSIVLFLIFDIKKTQSNEIKNLQQKNFQKIYQNKDKLFIENIFFEQIPDRFNKKQNFLFGNINGEIFSYNFKNDCKEKIFDLKIFLKIKNKKHKYKFEGIEIYRINSENFIILSGNTITFLQSNKNKKFSIKWNVNSLYQINQNSIIINNNLIIFSKSNNTIEARNIVDGSLVWFFEDSTIRNIKIQSHPVLFIKNNNLFAFFANGKIIELEIKNGLINKEKSFSSDQMNSRNTKLFFINQISDEKTRLNFENNDIIVMTNKESIFAEINNFKLNLNFRNDKKFQEIIYTKNNIYGIYENKFLLRINKDYKTKIFSPGFNFHKINFRNTLLSNFKIKNNNSFFEFKPKVFLVKNNKFLMFIGSEKKDVFYFDLEKEIFLENI